MTDMPTTVYRLLGERNTYLYVGITSDIDKRLRSHAEKTWWRDVRRIEVTEYPNREEASRVERQTIRDMEPLHNKVYNGTRHPAKRIPAPRKAGDLRLIGLAQAADYAGCSTKTIRRRISDGTLTGYRFGPRVMRVDLNELDAAMRVVPALGDLT